MAKKRKLAPQAVVEPIVQEEQPIQQQEPEPIVQEDQQQQQPIKDEPIVEEPSSDDEEGSPTLDPSITPQIPNNDEDDDEDDDETDTQQRTTTTTETNNNNNSSSSEAIDESYVRHLLEPFSKDQLITLLTTSALSHPPTLQNIQSLADLDPSHRKIFVHGLGWDTTADTLTSYFTQYGEIEDVKAVTDKLTGKSKGYAFILFKHRSGAQNALKEPQKKIGNRMAACQLASAGPVHAQQQAPPAPPVSEYTARKIYITNVAADIDPQKLYQFFAKFGEIEEGPMGLDKVTGKPKGFALFAYKTVESARKALEEPHKQFEGHVLHCQKAIDGPKQNKMGGFQNFGRGEGAGFRGGQVNVAPSGGHLMAPSGAYQAPVAPVAGNAGLDPALGQALTALLTGQGAGLGLGNLLGGIGGGGMVNQGGVQGQMMNSTPMQGGGYGNQGGYNAPMQGGYNGAAAPMQGGYNSAGAPMQGGYGSSGMGQGSAGRGKPGAGQFGGYMGR